jgi:hypothetical protein
MAAVTLLLVALLKNAERRAEHAIQGKLDRLAEAMLAARREHPDDGAEQLEEAVGMHDEVWRVRSGESGPRSSRSFFRGKVGGVTVVGGCVASIPGGHPRPPNGATV